MRALLRGKLLLVTIMSFFLLASCGKNPENQIVKNVDLRMFATEDGDAWVNSTALFKLGSMSMTSITLPIVDPYDDDRIFGKIIFKPHLTKPGYNEIGFQVNLTDSARIAGGFPTLPNGEDLPFGGINDKNLIELKVDKIHSKIYLGLAEDFTLIGFAIGIKEFQITGKYLNDANVFLGFDIKGFRGTAGLFTDKSDEYGSGLAFFADFSKLLSVGIINDILDGKPIKQAWVDNNTGAIKKPIGVDVDISMKSLRSYNPYMPKFNADYNKKVKSMSFRHVNLNNRTRKGLNKANKKIGRRRIHFVQD